MQVPIQSESGLFVCGGKIAIRLTSFAYWRTIKSTTNLILLSKTVENHTRRNVLCQQQINTKIVSAITILGVALAVVVIHSWYSKNEK